jgi:hypothetical protein
MLDEPKTTTTLDFEAGLEVDRVDAGAETLDVRGSFEFRLELTTAESGAVEARRVFRRESIVLRGSNRETYRLVGGARAEQDRRFVRVYDGVLVGTGRLNNKLLSIAIGFTESESGTAAAEVVALWLDRRHESE